MIDEVTGPMSSYLPNLGALLDERGLKQAKVAFDLDCDVSLISCWVRGKRRVPSHYLPKLAALLNLSMADLMVDGSNGWTPPEPELTVQFIEQPAAAPALEAQVAAIKVDAVELVARPQGEPERPRRRPPVKLGTVDPMPMVYRPPVLCHAGPSCPCRIRRKEYA